MRRLAIATVVAFLPGVAMAQTTCIDLGGGMVSCSGDGNSFTGMDLGGGMRTYNGQLGGRQFNGTQMELGGGISTFNGNVGNRSFNSTCIRTGNMITCN
jgi:hypothetical protein